MDVTSATKTNPLNKAVTVNSNVSEQTENLTQETNVTDTVTLSDEAIAAANGETPTPTPTPQHGGGGVYVPPVKE